MSPDDFDPDDFIDVSDGESSVEALFARIDAERKAWPIRKKIWMNLRWKVGQPARRFPREVKWFIQRGRRGWSTCDMWSMDMHIARLNVEMIARLREVAHGYPMGLTRGDDEQWITDEQREERWVVIQEIDAQIGFTGGPNDGFERWIAMLAYFEEGWRGMLDNDHDIDIYRTNHARFKAMMPMYAEWFSGLWD